MLDLRSDTRLAIDDATALLLQHVSLHLASGEQVDPACRGRSCL